MLAACVEWGMSFLCVGVGVGLVTFVFIYLFLSSFFKFSFLMFQSDGLILDGYSQTGVNSKPKICQLFRGINSKSIKLSGCWHILT